MVSIFKVKSEIVETTGLKLISHTKKLLERVARLRSEVSVSSGMFSFRKKESQVALRILLEKNIEDKKLRHCVFIDFGKAYDRIRTEERWIG